MSEPEQLELPLVVIPDACSFCKTPRPQCVVVFVNPNADAAVCDNCVILLTNRLYHMMKLHDVDTEVIH
jgi:hypothetical protein